MKKVGKNIIGKNIIKSDDAVSEVIGMVLVLSVSMLIIGIIIMVGLPMIDSGKAKSKMNIETNAFLSFQNDIEEVVRGPVWVKDPFTTANTERLGPSRESEFELMEGSLSVIPNNSNITFSSYDNMSDILIPSSNVIYADIDNINGESITYENGAVIREYESGPMMISDPLISIYDTGGNMTISIHAITINGSRSSVGGKGKAWAEIRLRNYSQIVEPSGAPNFDQTNLTIYSKYPDIWKNYFEMKLKSAGLNPSFEGNITGYNISGTNPLKIQVYGNVDNKSIPDIFLSVYESKIDIKVR